MSRDYSITTFHGICPEHATKYMPLCFIAQSSCLSRYVSVLVPARVPVSLPVPEVLFLPDTCMYVLLVPYRETAPPGTADLATVNQGWPIRSTTSRGRDQSLGVGNLPSLLVGIALPYASL